jgi:hypothetical protein
MHVSVAPSQRSTGIAVGVGLLARNLVAIPLGREVLEFIVDH